MRCRGCGVELTATNTPPSRLRKGDWQCRNCNNKERIAWRRKNYKRWRQTDNERRRRNKDKINSARNLHNLELKRRIIAHYGAECSCCGEKTPAFLTIDHIDGGGDKHRKQLFGKNMGGTKFYHWLEKQEYPRGYSVLCWNCNCGKRINRGICPHQETKE